MWRNYSKGIYLGSLFVTGGLGARRLPAERDLILVSEEGYSEETDCAMLCARTDAERVRNRPLSFAPLS